MSFDRPTLGALIRDNEAAYRARIPGADTLLRRSNLRVTARVQAALFHQQYGYLDWQFRNLLPDTAEAEYLERWCRIAGIARKQATFAAGNLVVTGTPGAVLSTGAVFTRPDGITFTTQADAVLTIGTATVAIRADAAGTDSNLPAGTQLTLTVARSDITGNAYLATGGTAGALPQEGDDALRERLLIRLREPPQGGARSDYEEWALDQPGVTRAFVFPARRGAGTVDVAFVMDDRANIIPLSGDIAAVQAALDVLRPVTADMVVFAPTPQTVPLTISNLTTDTADTRASVLTQLAAMFRRDAKPGVTLYRSRIIDAISDAIGEDSHTLTLPAGDVTYAATTIPVLGTVTFA